MTSLPIPLMITNMTREEKKAFKASVVETIRAILPGTFVLVEKKATMHWSQGETFALIKVPTDKGIVYFNLSIKEMQ